MTLNIKLSPQAFDLLKQIAERGIWGTTPDQVAARLVDAALIEKFVAPMRLNVAIERKADE